MNLFELSQQSQQLQELLLSGEIDEQIFNDTVESIGLEEKLESYCKVIRNIEADAVAYKKLIDDFTEKKRITENSVDRLKQAIINHMTALNQEKAKAGLFSISKCESQSVTIEDESKIPKMYTIKQDPKIDKKAIKAAIDGGLKVKGACIVKSQYVRIK
jgi:Siphovirus Gp157.